MGLIIASSPVVTENYSDDFIIGFEHHRPTASRRSIWLVLVRANPVSVGVVAAAAAAAVVGPSRSCADRSRAHCRSTDTVAAIAVAPAAHSDSAAAAPSRSYAAAGECVVRQGGDQQRA